MKTFSSKSGVGKTHQFNALVAECGRDGMRAVVVGAAPEHFWLSTTRFGVPLLEGKAGASLCQLRAETAHCLFLGGPGSGMTAVTREHGEGNSHDE